MAWRLVKHRDNFTFCLNFIISSRIFSVSQVKLIKVVSWIELPQGHVQLRTFVLAVSKLRVLLREAWSVRQPIS